MKSCTNIFITNEMTMNANFNLMNTVWIVSIEIYLMKIPKLHKV